MGNTKALFLGRKYVKSAGGLGLKAVHVWNSAALCRNIWLIVSGKNTLWSKWVTVNKLKKLSFWGITKIIGNSWSWNNLLKLRQYLCFFTYKLGNGSRFHFWDDPWIDGQSLKEKFPNLDVKDSGIRRSTKVIELWKKMVVFTFTFEC